MSAELLATSTEVEEALFEAIPVVALEVGMITHALGYPANSDAASGLAKSVRDAGSIPAFVAIVDRKLRVGLEDDELDRLLTADRVEKVAQRDAGAVLAAGGFGATTVSLTLFAAASFGIRMMVTGGIGGVHRGYSDSHDVSADLSALATTPVGVVCSGAKSILDLSRTLEALESASVPVLAFGTDEFPAYETRNSGLLAPRRVDDIASIAEILSAHWGLGMRSGAVIANPIAEDYEVDGAAISTAISQGIAASAEEGVRGKDITPYLLERISAATAGESSRAALALTLSNARLAGQLAAELELTSES